MSTQKAPIKASQGQERKKLYVEGLANHSDRESCADISNDVREALTTAHAGWVLSPENQVCQSADTVVYIGRQKIETRI